MKAEIKEESKEKAIKTYPWIGVDKTGDLCIFTEEDRGLYFCWDGAIFMHNMNMADFEVFTGTITLSN